MKPEVMSQLVILAGLMMAGLRLTKSNLWESHRRCPRCRALPGSDHAEGCHLADRL